MPLRLKKSSGWFAAGQEVATALELLSDAAFKLYMYVCLRAERRSARIVCQPWARRAIQAVNPEDRRVVGIPRRQASTTPSPGM